MQPSLYQKKERCCKSENAAGFTCLFVYDKIKQILNAKETSFIKYNWHSFKRMSAWLCGRRKTGENPAQYPLL